MLSWLDAGGYHYSCSGNGEQAVCTGTAGTKAFNSSGRMWAAPLAGSQTPFVTTSGLGTSIGGVMEACEVGRPAGCRTISLRSMRLGGVSFSTDLSDVAVEGGQSLGPWVLPRVQAASPLSNVSDPVGDDGLLLVSRGDGLIMAWNVELSLWKVSARSNSPPADVRTPDPSPSVSVPCAASSCAYSWATRFLCLDPSIDECNAPSDARLTPLGPPALLESGGSAYFSTTVGATSGAQKGE